MGATRLKTFAAIAVCAGMAAFLLAAMGGWRYDDPYITYRYADNIRAGMGFVYNPGQRALSTTTPLFAILLAALKNPWLNAPALAVLLGAVSLALGGLAFWEMGRAWKTELAGWAGLILFPTFPLLIVTLGSETPLVMALCLWALACAARGRHALSGALAGLAFVARADAAILALIIGVAALAQAPEKIKTFRAFALAWLIPVLAWVIFAAWYFGSPLPATLAVKQAQGRMAISQLFAPGFATARGWYLGGWHITLENVVAGAGVVIALVFAPRWLQLVAWSALYFAAYAALGVSGYFWYYAPLSPGFMAALGMGVEAVFRALRRLNARAAALACLCFIGLMGFMQAKSAINIAAFAADKRPRIYRAVGEWLSANTPPDASAGVLEAGIIGYYSHRPMVDFAGLIQPELAQTIQRETTYDDLSVLAVDHFHPAYLVLVDGSSPKLEARATELGCLKTAQFAGADYGFAQNISILKCD